MYTCYLIMVVLFQEPIVHELYLYDTILRDGKPDMSLYDLSKYKASSGASKVVEEDDDEVMMKRQ